MSCYQIRTDLILDLIKNYENIDGVIEKTYVEDDVYVSNIEVLDEACKIIDKKAGYYTTIYFDDVSDSSNRENVKKIFSRELKKILDLENIKDDDSCLVIGLGNEKVTPDSLGPKTIDNIIVTKHIYDLTKSLEDGYRITSKLAPGVMGDNGIETSVIISSLIQSVKPDFIIVVDALASDYIGRVAKTIQISTTGICPGSGIGNKRQEISKEIFNIPVISIGVPMVVDAVTIVFDTFNFMTKHFSYNINNKDDVKNKLIPSYRRNYLKDNNIPLSKEETTYFLGAFGNLSDFEKKALIYDVLTPIGYNFMVTLKEVDFNILQLSEVLSYGINNSLHKLKNK